MSVFLPDGSRDRPVLCQCDVFPGLRVDVRFGQTVVDDVKNVLLSLGLSAYQHVLRLHVSEDQSFGMDLLNPGEELQADHQSCLGGESSAADSEEFLQVWSEEVEHQGVVAATLSVVVDPRQGVVGAQSLVEIKLQEELRDLGVLWLQLDGELLL